MKKYFHALVIFCLLLISCTKTENKITVGKQLLIPVKLASNWGYIDTKGKYVINPQFDEAWDFKNDSGLTKVKLAGKWGYIDRTGKYVVNPQFDDAYSFDKDSGLASVKLGSKWGYIDKTGKYVINPQFDEIFDFIPIENFNLLIR